MEKLKIENLYFSYNGKEIIKDFSLTLQKGDICGLLGANGSGKTTLLRIISGLEIPKSGTIIIDGNITNSKDIFMPPEKRNIGLVFQDYGLFPHLNVEKNIAFGLHPFKKEKKKEIIETMLELIRMKDLRKYYPYQLSGGQQQRVALARSLSPSPQLILLDEPFSNLDVILKSSIREDIKNIIETMGITCILSTHDEEDVKLICKTTTTLNKI